MGCHNSSGVIVGWASLLHAYAEVDGGTVTHAVPSTATKVTTTRIPFIVAARACTSLLRGQHDLLAAQKLAKSIYGPAAPRADGSRARSRPLRGSLRNSSLKQ